ncbi:MAG: efflux RND transporter periplasmic adaptor subunit [Gammaproteobacteria bacterium]|jgi:cobalt-zinc-cadmium efflux system membrane fusion protein|nr:efflux RND transporter periplasmic adaptor subunit [Gammaproteobacteria bacterium]
MKQLIQLIFITLFGLLMLNGCSSSDDETALTAESMHGDAQEPAKGPHGGRLLVDGDFTLELAIFETGIPPEFRVWSSYQGQSIEPANIDLNIQLIRLGDRIDDINFAPQADFLRGDMVIYEPHSFEVVINAAYRGRNHAWRYDNFEGRTTIDDEVADAFGIKTEIAGTAVVEQKISVYGRIIPNQENIREVSARFDGSIRSVQFSVGDSVSKGQILASIESNESLNTYSLTAPISGVITQRNANPGEQTDGRQLFTIMNRSSVWASLALFPGDRSRVKVGAPVSIAPATGGAEMHATISRINVVADDDQSVKALVVLDNADEQFLPGTFVTAQITIGEHAVPLAVKRSGLQPFRDFTVVYAKIGEQYEVRMLDLGRQNDDWVEILGGLEAGTRYVSENSYVIKADIEKSGASHDH